MVRNNIKNSSLLRTKFLIYAFNGRTCNNAYADVFQTDFADSINASDVEEWARTINEDDNNTTEEKGAKKKASK